MKISCWTNRIGQKFYIQQSIINILIHNMVKDFYIKNMGMWRCIKVLKAWNWSAKIENLKKLETWSYSTQIKERIELLNFKT